MEESDSQNMDSRSNRRSILLALVGVAVVVVCSLGVSLVLQRFMGDVQSSTIASLEATDGDDNALTADNQPVDGSGSQDGANGVEPAKLEVMMIGDILMHDELVVSGAKADGTYDYGFLYDHITDYIDAADMRMLNQETVMGEPERGYHYYMGTAGPVMNTPTALADTEAEYGFNVILKATNHVLDLGFSGLGHELDYWKQNYPQIPVVGVSNPNAPAGDDSQNYVDNVYVADMHGLKVGILNYTWATNENPDWEAEKRYVSYLSEDKIRHDIELARAQGAEMLIACPHWGIEYTTVPSAEEEHYSQLFCDLGVDVIFGCHPHILQPLELLQNAEGHKTVCFYSMGNFVAAGGMQTDTLIGGIARVTMERDAEGNYDVSAASIVPTVICYTTGPNMSAWPLTEWTDELAAQSVRSNCTPAYATNFVANLYGDQFDPSTGVVTLDMGTGTGAFGQTGTGSSTSTSTSTAAGTNADADEEMEDEEAATTTTAATTTDTGETDATNSTSTSSRQTQGSFTVV